MAGQAPEPPGLAPLPSFPFFRQPDELFPAYRDVRMPTLDSFPAAIRFHRSILKLPVWHAAKDEPIVQRYLDAFSKGWRVLAQRQ